MTNEINPLLPQEVDLRDFPFMPLDVDRLRDSDLAAVASAEEFRAAVLLWCASWHQIPAASLPNDDRVLAAMAGFGRGDAACQQWQAVRSGALSGFIQCSDGRLYHPVVAEKALEAWQRKLQAAAKREEHRTRMEAFRKEKSKRNERLSVSKNSDYHSAAHGDDHVIITDESRDVNVISLTGIETGTGNNKNIYTPDSAAQKSGEKKRKKADPKPITYTEPFGRFWAIYPRPINKLAAFKAWEKALTHAGGGENAVERVLEATEAFAKASKGKDPQYIPHPASWLNAGGWDDYKLAIQSQGDHPPGYVPMGVGG